MMNFVDQKQKTKEAIEERQRIVRCVNVIMDENPVAVALKAVQTLDLIVKNIITNPSDPKYRAVKVKKPGFQTVAAARGGVDMLRQLGFVIEVRQFEEFYVFHGSDLSALNTAHEILTGTIARLVEAKQKIQAEKEKNMNGTRKKEVMAQIMADKMDRKDRKWV